MTGSANNKLSSTSSQPLVVAPGSPDQQAKPSESLKAFAEEFRRAKSPYQRVAALKRYAARKRFESLVRIRTLEEALDWGDSWKAACSDVRRDAERQIQRLQTELIYLRAELTLARCALDGYCG